ncbi:septal ring lytic transglycosylase RlpA family protein [Thalassospiraceae bacterium LMO-JJ14]|nr:septal ring lytic transglycosylase RlpA family protein [Thalassospiraceae bacterium LMO-JJ14]
MLLLTGCAETEFLIHTAKRVSRTDTPPPGEGTYKVGNPYQIDGIWYHPAEDYEYDETGIASWYGAAFHGKLTANGEDYDMNALTAAHRTLPMPSFVRVTNLENGRSLVLKVNDRGPFAKGRIIDISRRGAQLLGFQNQGTARVRVQILADQSQAVAARLQNRDNLARVGSPITVDKMPKASVSAEALPAPSGAEASPSVTAQPQPVLVASNDPLNPTGTIPNTTAPSETAALNSNPDAALRQEPVRPTSIYVQAGAFGLFDNANKVRARLSPLGKVFLDQVLINGRDLYRVRIGPLSDVHQADATLAQVIGTGYPDARIIVD